MNMKYILLATAITCLTGCGSGGSSSSSSSSNPATPSVVTLTLGAEAIDVSDIDNGIINIRFPAANGDLPSITSVIVDGAIADGFADIPSGTADITIDGVDIYAPFAGDYTITITVEDAGDPAVDRVINVSIPNTAAFPLSGRVEDGPAGSELGITTQVRLYWQAPTSSNIQIASTQSNDANNGSFTFTNLVGPPSFFNVVVDGGID